MATKCRPRRRRNKITLPVFCCFHAHLRQEWMLRWAVKMMLVYGIRGWHLDMPNTDPPVLDDISYLDYQIKITKEVVYWQKRWLYSKDFKSIGTIQLTPLTTPEMIRAAYRAGVRHIKVYPKDVTNNSANGIVDYLAIYECLAVAEELGMFVHFHSEHPSRSVEGHAKERHFLDRILKPILIHFPKLKVVVEHISTAYAVAFVKHWYLQMRHHIAATVTTHHMLLTEDNVIGYSASSNYKGEMHHLAKPSLKRRRDLLALQRAVVSHLPCFFLGTDTAPHLSKSKYHLHCACGNFNTPATVPAVLSVFEKYGKLSARAVSYFASHAGADFFDLPRVTEKMTVVRKTFHVPEKIEVPGTGDYVVPGCAGWDFEWTVLPIGA